MTDQQDTRAASTDAAGPEQSKPTRLAEVATSEAAEVATTAAESVRDVVEEASAQVKSVATQTRQQIDELVGKSRDELRLQAEQRGSQAAGQLRTLSEQITALTEGRPESAGPLVGYLGDIEGQVRQLASRLEHGGAQGLVDDVSSFARRRPGLFLAAAVGAGFVAGRVARATSANQRDDGRAVGSSSSYRTALTAPSMAASNPVRALP